MSKFRIFQVSANLMELYRDDRLMMAFFPGDLAGLASCTQAALAERNSGVMCKTCNDARQVEDVVTDERVSYKPCPACHSTQNTKDQEQDK